MREVLGSSPCRAMYFFLPCDIWWPVWVRARAASSKGTVSSVPAWFREDSETNLIKQGEIVTGRQCGSVVSGQNARSVCERSWVRVPVGPCTFSSPVTYIYFPSSPLPYHILPCMHPLPSPPLPSPRLPYPILTSLPIISLPFLSPTLPSHSSSQLRTPPLHSPSLSYPTLSYTLPLSLAPPPLRCPIIPLASSTKPYPLRILHSSTFT